MYNPETLEGEARTRMVSAIVITALFGVGGLFAVPAIIRSFKAMRLAKAGDFDNAFELYSSAKKFIALGIIFGIIFIVFYTMMMISC